MLRQYRQGKCAGLGCVSVADMQFTTFDIAGPCVMTPEVHRDDRGFFTRTFDAQLFDAHCAEQGWTVRSADFLQDSQSRSTQGVRRGLHGRGGAGEAKLVRCAHGAILDVIVDIRPDSPTYGQWVSVQLDDRDHAHLYIPRGFLHGFHTLSASADVCYRIDRPHDPSEDIGCRHDDPDLAITWPAGPVQLSVKDSQLGSFAAL